MSAMIQCERYDASLLNSTKSNGYASKSAHENQFAKSVEAALYAYPIWKVSFEQYKNLYDNGIFETRYSNERHGSVVNEVSVLQRDYILRIKLIEETLTILSPMQREFIQQRYFEKMPFKIIAEKMAVVERHLYRIRQDIIRIFAMSFGW